MGKLAPGRFRDGEINNVLADLHVPDMVCARLGDVIPTDFKFMEGNATKVDRSSLTGESLSMIQSEGDEGYSGSGFKQGEIEAVMTSTSLNTFLGHAAEKIASGRPPCTAVCRWRCQRTVRDHCGRLLGCGQHPGADHGRYPVAMSTVLSVMLAIGSPVLAKENAIVARLTYSEEMVGMLYAALSACTENIKVTDVMYHPT
ncbi:hypothetical protein PI124_g19586 [Phytophthora idaei]|nr:hypothetical protein PI125_g19918 [Phytophthora idaei]KAG3235377.1 hypothetical protein PI124_g19586 [Phytophthora idaei]